MAFTNTIVRQDYQGDNSTVTFAIPFEVISDSSAETKVYIVDESVDPSTETLQVEGSDYSIVNDDVVFSTAPATTDKVWLVRELNITQTLDLITSGAFLPQSQEVMFDKVIGLIQQVDDKVKRSPVLRVTDDLTPPLVMPPPEAGKVLGWDASGTLLQLYSVEDLGVSPGAFGAQAYVDFTQSALAAATPGSGVTRVYGKTDGNLYKKTSDGVERLLGQGALTVSGSRGTPNDIVAGTGITFTAGTQRNVIFIQGSGGAVTVSASPPIQAGTISGQEIILVGRSDTNTVTFNNSASNLELNGDITMGAGSVLGLVWDGTAWVETFRNGL